MSGKSKLQSQNNDEINTLLQQDLPQTKTVSEQLNEKIVK